MWRRGLRSFAYGMLAVVLGVALARDGLSPVAIGSLITVSLVGDFCGTYVIGLTADQWGRRQSLSGLALLVCGNRIVGWDRGRRLLLDEAGVGVKFGVCPPSIPDWLGLVGDAADGYPGIRGWRAHSAATVLAHYAHLEAIPADPHSWGLSAISASRAAASREPDAAPGGGAAVPHPGDAARGCTLAGNAGRSGMAGRRRATARGLPPVGR